jgi:hypothetical protein
MSSTIDNINANIISKIDNLQKIITIYGQYNLDVSDNQKIEDFDKYINEILLSYEFGSLNILKNYCQSISDNDKHTYYNKYTQFINTENILGKLKRVYMYCRKLQKIYDIDNEMLFNAFYDYDYIAVEINPNTKTIDNCSCGNQSIVESKTSESICKCGKVEKLYGIVFEDEQFFYQEGQRTKHGKYDPTKHCKFWVDRIQAKENTEMPESLINGVKGKIKRDNIWLESLTCNAIREYLKELKKTRYNDHVPLIRKIITGIEPPQLTDYELKLIYVYFARVMQIFNKTKPDGTFNSPYHPFFVYKILEQILKKSDDKKRRDDILACIHLQSRETLINHDLIWEPICNQISEFTYIPTHTI